MIHRRAFLGTLGLLAAPLVVEAQATGKVEQSAAQLPRIGVLMLMPMTKAVQDGFRQGLRDHGSRASRTSPQSFPESG